jgi:hypothetical protein
LLIEKMSPRGVPWDFFCAPPISVFNAVCHHAAMTDAPRYAPEIPFPPYSYVSGHWPHPLRDPAGHSFGTIHAPASLPDQSEWQGCREYCYAVDLWNAGFYWEAHEHWEALWHAAGRTGATADFFKGLIKLAAAGVKVREGRTEGVLRHLERARQLFQQVFLQVGPTSNATAAERYWGLQWQALLQLPDTLAEALVPIALQHATDKQSVLRVWDAQLVLA